MTSGIALLPALLILLARTNRRPLNRVPHPAGPFLIWFDESFDFEHTWFYVSQFLMILVFNYISYGANLLSWLLSYATACTLPVAILWWIVHDARLFASRWHFVPQDKSAHLGRLICLLIDVAALSYEAVPVAFSFTFRPLLLLLLDFALCFIQYMLARFFKLWSRGLLFGVGVLFWVGLEYLCNRVVEMWGGWWAWAFSWSVPVMVPMVQTVFVILGVIWEWVVWVGWPVVSVVWWLLSYVWAVLSVVWWIIEMFNWVFGSSWLGFFLKSVTIVAGLVISVRACRQRNRSINRRAKLD
eukprot:TRINITY_DN9615_c0_g1_i2.p1 TRINITY_DN9615_c0_g1~~TRINITY_DN9615_c0_g1_i2.p1  ORF type:complete len:299 (+),score=45.65 TRINITY_DN9615_c0_g1_i2:144-1040(+)